MPDLARLLAVARGDARADLLVRGGRVVNVFSGEIEAIDIAIADGKIASLGQNLQGDRTFDLDGAFVVPGLIDSHVHIESSLCVPAEFAAAVVPRGVTAVVADPHELANVVGTEAVRWMHRASRGLPLDVILMGPSCVPATSMATAGASIDADDLQALLDEGLIHGLAEAMNFPGVIGGDTAMLAKLQTLSGRPIDGHAPGVRGSALAAYIAAGVTNDHEAVTADEAREKLARGMYVLIREATNARNLDALLPIITPANARRICFCTDDRTPSDLLRDGSIDMMLRRAIAFGIEPIEAIRMATLNAAECFGLMHLGAIAPGRDASFFVCDNLKRPVAEQVFSRGELVACDGRLVVPPPATAIDSQLTGCSRFEPTAIDLRIRGGRGKVRVIGSNADQLLTDRLSLPPRIENGYAVADVSRDLLKMAVVERHRGTGNVGLGFIQGFGLKRGAIAGTVAHDHHNLVCIGADDRSMHAAISTVKQLGGGLVVCDGDEVLAQVALPVGGLMSDQRIDTVAREYDRLVRSARAAWIAAA
ncbi:MAG: adenine deaminase [Tepidisphaeraceae bacterium]